MFYYVAETLSVRNEEVVTEIKQMTEKGSQTSILDVLVPLNLKNQQFQSTETHQLNIFVIIIT